jgi:hypothetical protein
MDELRIPGDPHGITEAHDVLAADEFAMPAHADAWMQPGHNPWGGTRSGVSPLVVLGAAAVLGFVFATRRRR